MTVRAVIVGIGKYGDESLNVSSPVLNAIEVALWAHGAGIKVHDIFLFVSPRDSHVTRRVEELGITIQDPECHIIDAFLRDKLLPAEERSRLFLYWSGHGMTDSKGQRVLLCADYTKSRANRVFNASLFFRKLRTEKYNSYLRALVLADVCATNRGLPIEPESVDLGDTYKRNHLIYFATPEGGFAQADTGEGAFTFHALKILKNFQQFPDFDRFKTDFDEELKQSNLPRFLLELVSEDDRWESRIGKLVHSSDEVANSLIELLVAHNLSHKMAEAHFKATVLSLGNPRIREGAYGVTGMVRELSGLRDNDQDRATHGLVQFVLRLSKAEEELEPALVAWLGNWADHSVIEHETDLLEAEKGRSLLIIEVTADSYGNISALRPSLRSLDQTQVRGPPLGPIPIRTWADVENGVSALLQTLEEVGFTDLEIHFVVEATVFHCHFHHLLDQDGVPLGQKYGVILHHRERVLPSKTSGKRAWMDRKKALESIPPSGWNWTRCAKDKNLPTESNLCFAEWDPDDHGKKRLGNLIRLGTPVLYWRHKPDEVDAYTDMTELVQKLKALARMPDAIRTKRLSEVDPSGSLLWDAMHFQPYGD